MSTMTLDLTVLRMTREGSISDIKGLTLFPAFFSSSCLSSMLDNKRCNESTLYEVAKVLEFQLYHHSFQRNPRADLLQNGLVGSPCSPRDSQESSPTPQYKSINSSALSLLHSPIITSIHDHRKNHSLD